MFSSHSNIICASYAIISCFTLVRRGGSGKTNGVRKKEVVAVEGTENATGNNSEVRRFFEAQGETSPSLYIYNKYATIKADIMQRTL